MKHTDLDFLLSHFDQYSLFPRKMMTLKSNGQFTVTSREEILIKCEQSNFEDCRINAYPKFTDYKGIVRQPPNFIFIDLDLANFSKLKEPKKALDKALRNTLKSMSTSFQARLHETPCEQEQLYTHLQSNEKKLKEIKPTVVWTGNGYHVYLPINALVLDHYDAFSQTNYPSLFSPAYDGKYASWSVSELFLKFCSVFFSSRKADPLHRPKFKTCLIRIPNTFNSKCLSNGLSESDAKVKIIQKWNGHRPHIQLVTKDFRRWLMQEALDERLKRKKIIKTKSYTGLKPYSSSTIIPWIEELLRTPLEDKRKYCLYKILIPYLKNIKMQDETTIVNVLKTWLKDCDAKKSLNFNPMQIIRKDLRYVKEYKPIRLRRLEKDNFELYEFLTKQIILNWKRKNLLVKNKADCGNT